MLVVSSPNVEMTLDSQVPERAVGTICSNKNRVKTRIIMQWLGLLQLIQSVAYRQERYPV